MAKKHVNEEEIKEYFSDPKNKKKIEKMLNDPKINEEAGNFLKNPKRRKEAEETLKDENKTKHLLSKASSAMQGLDNLPVIGTIFDNAATLVDMVGDYISHDYTTIPVASIVTVVIGLIYFVSPIDIIPDFIPGVGYVDDALILALVFKGISKDLDKYREWKKQKAIPAIGITE